MIIFVPYKYILNVVKRFKRLVMSDTICCGRTKGHFKNCESRESIDMNKRSRKASKFPIEPRSKVI